MLACVIYGWQCSSKLTITIPDLNLKKYVLNSNLKWFGNVGCQRYSFMHNICIILTKG